jgi:hypothetical protein
MESVLSDRLMALCISVVSKRYIVALPQLNKDFIMTPHLNFVHLKHRCSSFQFENKHILGFHQTHVIK